MKRILWVLTALCLTQPFFGCAIVHQYPAYRGKVLELGTDKPIERAGVLVAYYSVQQGLFGAGSHYRGYQWALTDKEGRFTIPPRAFFGYRPFETFIKHPEMSIYKKGYGNYPGSWGAWLAKRGRSDPDVHEVVAGRVHGVPGWKEVTYWLPKLEISEEFWEHRRYTASPLHGNPFVLPPGMSREEFKELFGE